MKKVIIPQQKEKKILTAEIIKKDMEDEYRIFESQFLKDEKKLLLEAVRYKVKNSRKSLLCNLSELENFICVNINNFWEDKFNELCPTINENAAKFIDPFTFINAIMRKFFIDAEAKVTNNTGKFDSAIRCAAFCEILYAKKYITNTATRQKTMNDFANSRYGIDIKNSLSTAKLKARDNHKTKKVNGLELLKNCF